GSDKYHRVDFLFLVERYESGIYDPPQVPNAKEHFKFIVEIDGHDFHERTKEQAQRDKSRDRYLNQSGFTVFRFTGSEVFNDLAGKVDEVFAFTWNKAEEI